MGLLDFIREFRYYTRSDKIFGCFTAVATLVVYFISFFIIPLFYPQLHLEIYINTFLTFMFVSAFGCAVFMFLADATGYGPDNGDDYFMAGWFLCLMGFVLYLFYHLVIALKVSYTGSPKAEFFFSGKTNLDSIMNGGIVIGMIAAFLGIPVLTIRTITDYDLGSKFYSFAAGVFFASCVANLPEIFSAVLKWLNS